MPRVSRDGVSLYYETAGDEREASGNRETVVFIAGLGVGRWMWNWQREAVGEQFDVLLPDNRGSGRSDAALPPLIPRLPRALRLLLFTKFAGYSIAGLAADLDAVLADAGVDHAHVVGASMGGMIAQQYALDYDRARSLALLCTTPGGPEARPIPDETLETIFDVPEGADERERVRHRMGPAISDEFVEHNPETVEQIVDWRLEQDAGEAARESQGAAGANFDVSDRVGELDVPTLVLHGTADRVVPVENGELLAEAIPDSRLELVDGGSHLFMIENAERVNESLLDFLAANSKAAAADD
jgi:pimeloyl-ACP methyl ester carboxylesterase